MRIRIRKWTVVLGAVAALTLSGIIPLYLSATAAHAARGGAQVREWPSGLARPQAITCASGSKAVVPTSAATDGLGVIRVHYAAFPKFTTIIPPRGFSAARASQALLDDLGIHAMSTAGEQARLLAQSSVARADQQIASSRIPQSFCMSNAIFGPDIPATSASPAASAGHYWSHYWAGYTVNGSFTGVTGSWTVQNCISCNSLGQPNADGTWIGIGGDQNDIKNNPENYSLIQAGTVMMTNHAWNSWFEYISSNSSIDPTNSSLDGVTFTDGSTVRPGDVIYATVNWNTPSIPCFTFGDASRATGSFSGCINDPGIPYDTRSIEWIDEDPPTGWFYMSGNKWDNLAGFMSDFGHTYWTDQEAYDPATGNTVPFTDYGYQAAIMERSGQPLPPCTGAPLMAYPENAAGASSDNAWCSQGPN